MRNLNIIVFSQINYKQMSLNSEIFSLRQAIIKAKRRAIKQSSKFSSQSQTQYHQQTLSQNQQLAVNSKDQHQSSDDRHLHKFRQLNNTLKEQNKKGVSITNQYQQSNISNRQKRDNSILNLNKNVKYDQDYLMKQKISNDDWNSPQKLIRPNIFLNKNSLKVQSLQKSSKPKSSSSSQQRQTQPLTQLAHNLYTSRKKTAKQLHSRQNTVSFDLNAKQSYQERLKLSLQKSPLTYSRTVQNQNEQSRVSNFTIMNSQQQSATNRIHDKLNFLRRLVNRNRQKQSQCEEKQQSRFKNQNQHHNVDNNESSRDHQYQDLDQNEKYHQKLGLLRKFIDNDSIKTGETEQIDRLFKYNISSEDIQIKRLFDKVKQASPNVKRKQQLSIPQLIRQWKLSKGNFGNSHHPNNNQKNLINNPNIPKMNFLLSR